MKNKGLMLLALAIIVPFKAWIMITLVATGIALLVFTNRVNKWYCRNFKYSNTKKEVEECIALILSTCKALRNCYYWILEKTILLHSKLFLRFN